jgi:FlaA1/EpsC-like NDP-sugar epimerase
MDEDAKNQFKLKFYRLTVELNIIILFVAVSVLVFFIVHSPYTIPVSLGMLVLAIFLSRDFIRKYRETKAWLDEIAEKEKELKKETNPNRPENS